MFELSQLNVTEVAEFVQRNFQNLFTKGAPPGKQIRFAKDRAGQARTAEKRNHRIKKKPLRTCRIIDMANLTSVGL